MELQECLLNWIQSREEYKNEKAVAGAMAFLVYIIESIYHNYVCNDNVLTYNKEKCYDIEKVRRYVLWIQI